MTGDDSGDSAEENLDAFVRECLDAGDMPAKVEHRLVEEKGVSKLKASTLVQRYTRDFAQSYE